MKWMILTISFLFSFLKYLITFFIFKVVNWASVMMPTFNQSLKVGLCEFEFSLHRKTQLQKEKH